MNKFRRLTVRWGLASLLLLSALMLWEAFSPHTFELFFKSPVRNFVEPLYLAAVVGSVIFFGHAIFNLVHRRRPIKAAVVRLLLTLVWCLSSAMSCILMVIRTVI